MVVNGKWQLVNGRIGGLAGWRGIWVSAQLSGTCVCVTRAGKLNKLLTGANTFGGNRSLLGLPGHSLASPIHPNPFSLSSKTAFIH